jgi:hypothetical protein
VDLDVLNHDAGGHHHRRARRARRARRGCGRRGCARFGGGWLGGCGLGCGIGEGKPEQGARDAFDHRYSSHYFDNG